MALYDRNNVIEEIKSRCNIVDIIGSVVSLKKTGANYQGLCPFHNEKTPSFVVSETKQRYTCFGCHEYGDVINFVEKYYNLTFTEALERLAAQCGVKLEENYARSEKKDIYYEVNREAARFFYKALRQGANPGIRYIKERGLTKETLHDFGIGYADDSWNSLYKYLKSKGYEEDVMIKLGLVSLSKGKYYDKFRNRVIFPIQNTAGKVIGFGGRTIENRKDIPKYLNSQETPVFSKKNNLYGLNITKNHINKNDCAILVEGYMDVISLYQGGVKNVSASLGTALTENQAKLLKRFTKNIVLSYDADSAGVNAAIRGSEILYKEGCKVKILHISDGKDPDDFIKAKGKQAYYRLVDEALNYGEYRIKKISENHDINSTQGRVDFLKETADFLKTLSPVEADIYVKKMSETYGISQQALRYEIGMESGINGEKTSKKAEKREEKEALEISQIEQLLIKILITDSSYFDKTLENQDVFESSTGKAIFEAIKAVRVEGEEIDIMKLMDNLEPEETEALKKIDDNIHFGGKTEAIFNDCMKTHIKERLRKKEEALRMQIEIAEEQGNSQEAQNLTIELMKVLKERKLGGRS